MLLEDSVSSKSSDDKSIGWTVAKASSSTFLLNAMTNCYSHVICSSLLFQFNAGILGAGLILLALVMDADQMAKMENNFIFINRFPQVSHFPCFG